MIESFKERFSCCDEGFMAPKKVQQEPGPELAEPEAYFLL